MSHRSRRRLLITNAAERDLDEILTFTSRHWGKEKRREYGSEIRLAMPSLVANPELGRARDEYFPGCRGLVVERHVIFYHLDGDDIVVDHILHQNQDAASKLSR